MSSVGQMEEFILVNSSEQLTSMNMKNTEAKIVSFKKLEPLELGM